jgi:predicted acyltransferase
MLQLPRRLQSIDVFRAVTMFFMIFVNDVDGVERIPEWIKHVSANTDGLGFADTIFPAFLFIVGLSIPFALNKRIQSNESTLQVTWHIILRSLALIVMGFFHVNLENYSDTALLPHAVFEILTTLAFFLIWLDYKPGINKTKQYALQAAGIIILIMLAFLYKGESHGEVIGLRTHWWGILGLIGWAYLTCALVYLFTKGKYTAQVIALIFFLAFNIMHTAGMLDPLSPVLKYCWFLNNGSEESLIMAGVVISLVYMESKKNDKRNFLALILMMAVAMFVFGFLTRPIAGISKIHATPAWVGICAGISIIVFALLIFVVDVKGKVSWFNIIEPAGTSTLTCYLIPYFLYSFMDVFHFQYPVFLREGIGGILRSFAIAFIVIFITGFLEKRNLRLKI